MEKIAKFTHRGRGAILFLDTTVGGGFMALACRPRGLGARYHSGDAYESTALVSETRDNAIREAKERFGISE